MRATCPSCGDVIDLSEEQEHQSQLKCFNCDALFDWQRPGGSPSPLPPPSPPRPPPPRAGVVRALAGLVVAVFVAAFKLVGLTITMILYVVGALMTLAGLLIYVGNVTRLYVTEPIGAAVAIGGAVFIGIAQGLLSLGRGER